jgi:hypothetical protein
MQRKQTLTWILLLGILAALFTACKGQDLTSSTQLNHLVVLGLVTEPVSLQNPSAGTYVVSLDPYISDVTGTGTVSLEVESCLDPGVKDGAQQSCANALNKGIIQRAIATTTANMPAGIFGSPERTGKLSGGPILVPLEIPAGFLAGYSAAEQMNGIPYLIWVTAVSSRETVHAFRQILVSNQIPNQNPAIGDVVVNGVSLNALPKEKVDLEMTAASNPESYQRLGVDGQIHLSTEIFETTWFVSDGNLLNNTSRLGQSVGWRPPLSPPVARSAVLAGVLRDGRGGLSVIVKKF